MKDVFSKEEVDEVLRERFYRAKPVGKSVKAPTKRRKAKKKKPDHYEVICISMYTDDLARLDAAVKRLKKKGHRKMSRSALIRYALDTMDEDGLPRSY
jgi:hypothetical protein